MYDLHYPVVTPVERSLGKDNWLLRLFGRLLLKAFKTAPRRRWKAPRLGIWRRRTPWIWREFRLLSRRVAPERIFVPLRSYVCNHPNRLPAFNSGNFFVFHLEFWE